MIPISTTCSE